MLGRPHLPTGSLDQLDASLGRAGGVEGQLLDVELAHLRVRVRTTNTNTTNHSSSSRSAPHPTGNGDRAHESAVGMCVCVLCLQGVCELGQVERVQPIHVLHQQPPQKHARTRSDGPEASAGLLGVGAGPVVGGSDLVWEDEVEHPLLVDVRGQRQLHQDACHRRPTGPPTTTTRAPLSACCCFLTLCVLAGYCLWLTVHVRVVVQLLHLGHQRLTPPCGIIIMTT